MNATESEKLITNDEIETIRRILDHKIETDDDYLEIGKLAEDETEE